jgi:hypothetical protein
MLYNLMLATGAGLPLYVAFVCPVLLVYGLSLRRRPVMPDSELSNEYHTGEVWKIRGYHSYGH